MAVDRQSYELFQRAFQLGVVSEVLYQDAKGEVHFTGAYRDFNKWTADGEGKEKFDLMMDKITSGGVPLTKAKLWAVLALYLAGKKITFDKKDQLALVDLIDSILEVGE